MRVTAVLIAVTALGVATLVAAGIYRYHSANAPEKTAGLSPGATATATRPGKGFSFSTLKTPKPVPVLRFVDGEGREMGLEAFRGKTVLLNIWATWCVPCRLEMPTLDRLQAKLGGPDFQVVPLSIDREGLPTVKAFYEKLGLKALGVYVDRTGKAAQELGAAGIPTTLLVDGDGNEIGRTVGPAEWDSGEVLQVLRQYVKPPAAKGDRPEGKS
jgi:thiol-disulfide isomerase/thioredoxin